MSLMKDIYQAFINQGLSPNQARIMTAEVGRENDFQPQYVFGRHTDESNQKTNLGFISWQGKRAIALDKRLKSKGLIKNGNIQRSQSALNEMASYLVGEIKTRPEYKMTKKLFLENPNVSYDVGKKVLGNNFIRWDYSGKAVLGANVAKHHAKRDKYYNQLGGVSSSPQQDQFARPNRISIKELQAREQQSSAFQRPDRIPIEQLQAQSQFERPERVPISQLQQQDIVFERPERLLVSDLQDNEQTPSVFGRPERIAVSELEQQFARPERVPIEQLQGINQTNPMPEQMPQQL